MGSNYIYILWDLVKYIIRSSNNIILICHAFWHKSITWTKGWGYQDGDFVISAYLVHCNYLDIQGGYHWLNLTMFTCFWTTKDFAHAGKYLCYLHTTQPSPRLVLSFQWNKLYCIRFPLHLLKYTLTDQKKCSTTFLTKNEIYFF